MIRYILYEAEFHQGNSVQLVTGRQLARKLGLRIGSNKYIIIKFGELHAVPENTNKIAYIHLYPQIEEENYKLIKQNIINE